MDPINSESTTLLLDILERNSGISFYSFSNADGKQWIVPAKNMVTAMNLYQPSGVKGKMVKVLFPYLYWCIGIRKVIHAERLKCSLRNDLVDLLCEGLGVQHFEFSIFGGTPCVHQKITIQVSNGSHILGYCKICKNDEIFALFKTEAKFLSNLKKKGIRNIPQCLFCGNLKDGIGVFLQSTTKTNRSNTVHEWTKYQDKFLQEFASKTKQVIRFEESDFYQSLILLKQHLNWLPQCVNGGFVGKVVDNVIKKNQGKSVEFSAYHADFTPWNMFVENGQLFVFDFEYAKETFPTMLDKYHFFTQTAHFEKHWNVEQIIQYMQSLDGSWINKDLYSYYLLEVMSRFTMREKGDVHGDVLNSFEIWFKLLEYMFK